MGVYDRDYYREEEGPPGIQFNGQMMVTKLAIITAAILIVDLFTDHWLGTRLSITPEAVRHPWMWWQFLTYGFAHRDVWHVFWNMFVLWMFGREVESVYGRKELLRIYLLVLVLGSLVWCIEKELFFDGARYRLLGASGAVTAIMLLFVFNFPKRTILFMFVLPVPAWVLGVIVVGGDLLQFSKPLEVGPDSLGVAFDVHLVGAIFAMCYFRFRWNLGRLLPGSGGKRFTLSRLKPRPKLKIHDPDKRHQKQDEQADRILEKVSREGMDSLTSKERRILEDYSRRMRQKHQ